MAALVDFDRLIEKKEFSAPEGYVDMASFNDALYSHCLNHPSLVFEPSDNTTLKGHQAGWIEFGRPQDHPMSKAEPVVRSYQPHEGLVVLFPSYFYHRTEPFVSQEKRISIAFDILPIA